MKMSKDIKKECRICVVGRMAPDGMSILCTKKGIMNPDDKCFHFTPPTPLLVLKAAGIESGSGVPNKQKVASLTAAQVTEIAKTKLPDLNVNSLEAAESQVRGTCRSMGVTIVD